MLYFNYNTPKLMSSRDLPTLHDKLQVKCFPYYLATSLDCRQRWSQYGRVHINLRLSQERKLTSTENFNSFN